ncbi:hypothetical protein T09_3068 [Trichinella sp. T9]|nr:hypothetical protein T09_3068 [Trichinella sp. T9]
MLRCCVIDEITYRFARSRDRLRRWRGFAAGARQTLDGSSTDFPLDSAYFFAIEKSKRMKLR